MGKEGKRLGFYVFLLALFVIKAELQAGDHVPTTALSVPMSECCLVLPPRPPLPQGRRYWRMLARKSSGLGSDSSWSWLPLLRALIVALLVIGGIEMNPGPNTASGSGRAQQASTSQAGATETNPVECENIYDFYHFLDRFAPRMLTSGTREILRNESHRQYPLLADGRVVWPDKSFNPVALESDRDFLSKEAMENLLHPHDAVEWVNDTFRYSAADKINPGGKPHNYIIPSVLCGVKDIGKHLFHLLQLVQRHSKLFSHGTHLEIRSSIINYLRHIDPQVGAFYDFVAARVLELTGYAMDHMKIRVNNPKAPLQYFLNDDGTCDDNVNVCGGRLCNASAHNDHPEHKHRRILCWYCANKDSRAILGLKLADQGDVGIDFGKGEWSILGDRLFFGKVTPDGLDNCLEHFAAHQGLVFTIIIDLVAEDETETHKFPARGPLLVEVLSFFLLCTRSC